MGESSFASKACDDNPRADVESLVAITSRTLVLSRAYSTFSPALRSTPHTLRMQPLSLTDCNIYAKIFPFVGLLREEWNQWMNSTLVLWSHVTNDITYGTGRQLV